MLIVLTGQPRHGKTQYAVRLIFDYIKKNINLEKEGKQARRIYADIAGINAPDTLTQLPEVDNQWNAFGDSPLWLGEQDDPDKPDGYVCPPRGSILIFDECHKVDWIKDASGALSKNPTTISVNEHGHEDYIIILITQFPQYIHTHLRGLVELHYHVKRFNGLKQAFIYKWNEFKTTPRSKTAIDDVFEKETFKFNKKYFNAYKSASSHDSMKFKLPKEWVKAFILIAVLLSVTIYLFNDSPLKAMVTGDTPTQIVDVPSVDPIANTNTLPLENANIPDDNDFIIESLKDEIELLKEKYLDAHVVEMIKSVDITPAMVIASSTKCIATNRYGERLNVGDALCYEMASDSTKMPRIRADLGTNNYNNLPSADTGSIGDIGGEVTINRQPPINIY